MAHKTQSRTADLELLIRHHRKLKSLLTRARVRFPDSRSLRWPFEKASRPWDGDSPTPEQELGIEFRNSLAQLVAELRALFFPWDDDALRDLFPLLDCESGALHNKSSDWVLEAIERHIDSLRIEQSAQTAAERQVSFAKTP